MFDQFYQQSSDKLKLTFLEEAFRKYPNLKEDFLAFYLNPSDSQLKMTINDPDEFILANKDSIIEQLQSIDLNEPDWEDYVPRHGGYIPEYEAREHLAEDQLAGVLEWKVAEVEKYCSEKQFDLAFLLMISLYQACIEAELNDEYETVPNPTGILTGLLEDHLQSSISLFKSIQLTENQLFTIANVWCDQFHKQHSNEPDFLTFFEPFIDALIHSGAEANILLKVIDEQKVGGHIPWLFSELQKKTGGKQAWEQSARQVFKKNVRVANSLLEMYKTDNKPEFVRIARELWFDDLFQRDFAELYFEGMEPEDDPDLYRKVAIYLNDRNFSERYYQVLQGLMDKEERMTYIETFKPKSPAYVLALCMEGKYPEALRFAAQHTDRWNIVEIMTPCLRFQPEFALVILEKKIEELLVDERGRNFYERIAKVLKNAADIPVIQRNAKNLAIRIYSFYSRLPALREELRTAGLIKE